MNWFLCFQVIISTIFSILNVQILYFSLSFCSSWRLPFNYLLTPFISIVKRQVIRNNKRIQKLENRTLKNKFKNKFEIDWFLENPRKLTKFSAYYYKDIITFNFSLQRIRADCSSLRNIFFEKTWVYCFSNLYTQTILKCVSQHDNVTFNSLG